MEDDLIKKQMEMLWEKVRSRSGKEGPGEGMAGAFESVQAELQAAQAESLRARFEKEKSYWENLIAAKQEAIAQLQNEIKLERDRAASLKGRIDEQQAGQLELLKQTFATLDMQKRSAEAREERLNKDLESSRRELLDLQLKLKEAEESRTALAHAWEEKEKGWSEERERMELEANRAKQEHLERRRKDLEDAAKLERTIQNLGREIEENRKLYESEKTGFEKLLAERQGELEKRTHELEELRLRQEKEHEERRLAAVERENQSVRSDEERKRMTEQLLVREGKIRQLSESLAEALKEKTEREESLSRREREIQIQEEALRKRREEWVESIKGQSAQHLNISGKVVDLLGRVEWRSGVQSAPAVPPPPPPSFAAAPSPLLAPAAGVLRRWPVLKQRKGGIAMVAAGVALLAGALALWFFFAEGRKAWKVQNFLSAGNRQYVANNLDAALESFEAAYRIDPENSIVKNSYTLVLGEAAHQHFRDGRYEDALKQTETLSRLLPDDSEVVQLHQQILKALGGGGPGNLPPSAVSSSPEEPAPIPRAADESAPGAAR